MQPSPCSLVRTSLNKLASLNFRKSQSRSPGTENGTVPRKPQPEAATQISPETFHRSYTCVTGICTYNFAIWKNMPRYEMNWYMNMKSKNHRVNADPTAWNCTTWNVSPPRLPSSIVGASPESHIHVHLLHPPKALKLGLHPQAVLAPKGWICSVQQKKRWLF